MTTTTLRVIQIRAGEKVTGQTLTAEEAGTQLCRLIGCDSFDVVSLVDGIDPLVYDDGISRGCHRHESPRPYVIGVPAVLFGTAVTVSSNVEGETMGVTDNRVARIREAMQQRADPAAVEALASSLAPFPNIVAMLRG